MGNVVKKKMPEVHKSERQIIGLTGGIATGKSTVSDYLTERYGLPVLDADVYARQAVEPDSEILKRICNRYGMDMLLPDGTLNRPALGQIIFNSPQEKQWVEQQIHPFVREQFSKATASYPSSQALVYAIPLLFEAKLTHLVTDIWVVICTPAQQKSRLMARNNLSAQAAQSRIDAQMSLDEKCKRADCVLDNSHTVAYLFKQIDALLAS